MIEIHPNLFIGSQDDYEYRVRYEPGWHVVHACKEPYHRAALNYRGHAAPKAHPEYLVARRGNCLILNLIDADNPAYIPVAIIDDALDFIHGSITQGERVLVHCNQGFSRAPSIGLLYLVTHTESLNADTTEDAKLAFAQLYPAYAPAAGIWGFIRQNFSIYRARRCRADSTAADCAKPQ